MSATKFPAKSSASLQRESWVLAGVLYNLTTYFRETVSTDAIEVKFSVKSLPPQPTLSSEEEIILKD